MPRAAIGTYRNEDTESTVTVLEHEGRLELKTPHEQHEIVPVSRDLFRAGRFLIRFAPESGGRIQSFDVTVGSISGLRFDRQAE